MIKVLLVDDSEVTTQLLLSIVQEDTEINVIACAKNGQEALELTKKLKPDLITMDIFMPVMDGVEATKAIMDQCPTPIIIISTHASEDESSYVFDALKAGALSIIKKPLGVLDKEFEQTKRYIINAIRSFSEIRMTRRPIRSRTPKKSIEVTNDTKKTELIVLGASTGGPVALNEILSKLPKDFSVPIVIIQHISNGFLPGLLNWLQKSTPLKLNIAKDRQFLEAGFVYFAPDNRHLTIINPSQFKPIALLNDNPPIQHVRPSINVLFHSIAKNFPKTAVGGLLTGMGEDGAQGLLDMKKAGCITFAQSKKSSTVFGMPSAAVKLEAAAQILDLEQISQFLTILLKGQ